MRLIRRPDAPTCHTIQPAQPGQTGQGSTPAAETVPADPTLHQSQSQPGIPVSPVEQVGEREKDLVYLYYHLDNYFFPHFTLAPHVPRVPKKPFERAGTLSRIEMVQQEIPPWLIALDVKSP